MMWRSPGVWAMLCCAAVLSGCGGDPYRKAVVDGTVTTCEGKPAAGGVVVFYPIDDPAQTGRPKGNPGREARGTVGPDGRFSLTSIGIQPEPGAVIGRHRVTFEMPPTERATLTAEDREGMTPEEIEATEEELAQRPVYDPIPCSANITPGEVTVVAGKNTFDFTLPAQ